MITSPSIGPPLSSNDHLAFHSLYSIVVTLLIESPCLYSLLERAAIAFFLGVVCLAFLFDGVLSELFLFSPLASTAF